MMGGAGMSLQLTVMSAGTPIECGGAIVIDRDHLLMRHGIACIIGCGPGPGDGIGSGAGGQGVGFGKCQSGLIVTIIDNGDSGQVGDIRAGDGHIRGQGYAECGRCAIDHGNGEYEGGIISEVVGSHPGEGHNGARSEGITKLKASKNGQDGVCDGSTDQSFHGQRVGMQGEDGFTVLIGQEGVGAFEVECKILGLSGMEDGKEEDQARRKL